MKLWRTMNVEVCSQCNRACRTCLRTSTPDRAAVASWFQPNFLPLETIKALLDEHVVLNHCCRFTPNVYNEPLMDPRIVDILQLVRSYRQEDGRPRFITSLVTNGELLTPELAQAINPLIDTACVALYLQGPERRNRRRAIRAMLPGTKISFKGSHVLTHYGPDTTLRRIPCTLSSRILVNHRGQLLLCCEDMLGLFGLGSFPETTLLQCWTSTKRDEIVRDVRVSNDRSKYPYCQTCPMEK